MRRAQPLATLVEIVLELRLLDRREPLVDGRDELVVRSRPMTSNPFAAMTAAIGAPSLPRPMIETRGN